ncbi:hypothetical protein BGZ67_000307 [Mortierella alpina]|nr:hypothetical protein BGZ67_000307 [Mortierella alpina]
MANAIQSSAVEGDGDDIDDVCSTSDTNSPSDDKSEPLRQATPKKGMDVVLRRGSALPASQDPAKACENLEKLSPKNPTSACALAGSIFDAENHDLRPQTRVNRPQQGFLESRSVISGSGDEGMTSAPNTEAKNSDLSAVVDCCAATRTGPAQMPGDAQPRTPSNESLSPLLPSRLPTLSLVKSEPFDARPLEGIIQGHQDRTVQSFHVIARGLDRLSMELQFVFSEFLSRQYAQIDDLMKSNLSEIQCQEKEQERLLNQMVSFLNAMKNAFAIFGGSE